MSTHYPRPAILNTIPRDQHVVIEASAGTGKTFTIEHLVVELLLRRHAPIDQLLVLTFTERAAAELRMRIRALLVKVLNAACPGGTACRCDSQGGFWSIDNDARKRLTRALYYLDTAAIGTIHGFFARVLNEHAFAGRRLFEGTLDDGRTLFGRAFKTALRRDLARTSSAAAELLAVWLDEKSGGVDELETVLYQCAELRRDLRPPFDLDALRREIARCPLLPLDEAKLDRLAAVLKAAKVHGNTVKAICGNHLPALIARLQGAASAPGPLLDESTRDSLAYLKKNLGGLTLEGDAGIIAEAVAGLGRMLVPLRAAVVQTCLPAVRRERERDLNETGAYDFDEIILGVARAIKGPGGEELIRTLRRRYKFALIDEFQDTDTDQWSVLQSVFVDGTEKTHTAYLIGDPKQAIYGFRGADVRAYLRARTEIEKSAGPPIPLINNFRSTAAMIQACNLIFDQKDEKPFFDGESIQYTAPVRPGQMLSAVNADGTPCVPVHVLEIEPKGESLRIGELRRGLARQIAREVGALLSGPARLRFGRPGAEEALKPSDIYVLAATNADAQHIGEAFREAGVPFAFYKQEGLFQTPEARHVRDLLAAIDTPADSTRRARAWITPFFGVPLEALPALSEISDTHPLRARLTAWKDLADRRQFEAVFSRILDDSGVVLRSLLFEGNERALTNYLHLFELLLEHARAHGSGLPELLLMLESYIRGTRRPPAQDGNVQRLESDRAAVQVMSIHKSKGLQAAVVFVYGGFTTRRSDGMHEYHEGDQRILDLGASEEAKDRAGRESKEEQQRLFYVALTRAKARLYLPFVPKAFWSSRWQGGYKGVNDRLEALIARPDAEGLFLTRPFRDTPLRPGPAAPGVRPRAPESWRPARDDLALADQHGYFAALRARHRAYEVTSYSRMKQAWEESDAPIEPEDFYREPTPAAAAVVDPEMLAEGQLPGGRLAGTLLHEVLEKVPFDDTAATPGLEAWRRLGSVSRAVAEALTRSGLNPVIRADVEAIVHRALTVPIPLDAGRSLPGLCRCTPERREMEFLFPIPEPVHPRLAAAGLGGRLVVDRGFIKGFIDLVAAHAGRVYVIDWKSDVLDSYDRAAIDKHVAEHYEIQARLYALALVKALGLTTEAAFEQQFGGMLYLFLRGLRQPMADGLGVQYRRPSWAEILRYEEELIQLGDQSRSPSQSPSRGGQR